uniref:RNase H type-1 domain-containing protein n=1 Tax=Nelumbo nucifera TaxID=4432 RepID=A0A822Z519_NELNU|nr:TPA_asm: hypothetical protein HUJ06_013976 [Nelumbo nucifera]
MECKDFIIASDNLNLATHTKVVELQIWWVKPRHDEPKINFDVSRNGNRKCAVGVIVCDLFGIVRWVQCKDIGSCSINEAEAWAALKVHKWWLFGFLTQGDSKIIINGLTGSKDPPWKVKDLLSECCRICQPNDLSVSYNHILHKANFSAEGWPVWVTR